MKGSARRGIKDAAGWREVGRLGSHNEHRMLIERNLIRQIAAKVAS